MADQASAGLCTTLILIALLGCGTTPVATVTPTPIAPPTPVSFLQLDGNWEVLGLAAPGLSAILPSPIAAFTGALQSTKGQVVGTLRAVSSLGTSLQGPCVSLTQDLAATGTLDSDNHLTLTVPIAGGTATLAVTISQDPHTFADGTYTIVGGPCAMASTAMAMTQFAPLTGTYSGTLTSYPAAGTATTLVAVLTQATTPNADGLFPLAGKITIAGACAATFSFADGAVSGNGINTFVAVDPLIMPAIFHGAMVPDASSIQANVFLYRPLCSFNSLAGTLTRQ